MASEGSGQDDELGVRLDWPGDDTGFARRPDAAGAVGPEAENDDIDQFGSAEGAVDEPDAEPNDGPASPPTGPVPLLPALLNKLDNVGTTVSTLAMRIDALGATTNNLNSVLSDRISDYIDTVAHLTRSQQDVVEEYRHGNDRTVAELRRAIAESDALLRQVAARLDEVVTDVASLGDGERLMTTANDAPGAAMSEELESEIAGLRDDIVQLKRRIGVRAKAPAVLDEAQVGILLDRIVERIGPTTFADEDVHRVAQAVVAQLEQFLEVVPDTPASAPAPTPVPRPPPAPERAADAPKTAKKKAAGPATTSRRRSS
jgi:hypothetical protein